MIVRGAQPPVSILKLQVLSHPRETGPSNPLYPSKSAPIKAFGGVALDLQQIPWIGAHCGVMLRSIQYKANSWVISGCGKTRSEVLRIHDSCS
jgi:hypothetical protein